jgi:hypothetical protein
MPSSSRFLKFVTKVGPSHLDERKYMLEPFILRQTCFDDAKDKNDVIFFSQN